MDLAAERAGSIWLNYDVLILFSIRFLVTASVRRSHWNGWSLSLLLKHRLIIHLSGIHNSNSCVSHVAAGVGHCARQTIFRNISTHHSQLIMFSIQSDVIKNERSYFLKCFFRKKEEVALLTLVHVRVVDWLPGLTSDRGGLDAQRSIIHLCGLRLSTIIQFLRHSSSLGLNRSFDEILSRSVSRSQTVFSPLRHRTMTKHHRKRSNAKILNLIQLNWITNGFSLLFSRVFSSSSCNSNGNTWNKHDSDFSVLFSNKEPIKEFTVGIGIVSKRYSTLHGWCELSGILLFSFWSGKASPINNKMTVFSRPHTESIQRYRAHWALALVSMQETPPSFWYMREWAFMRIVYISAK